MSLSLMVPAGEVRHQLSHDLESLFLVFLHVVRFLSAPKGDNTHDNNRVQTHQISRWHHEASPTIMFTDKKSDLRDIFIDPKSYITDYWLPIAPYLKELFEAVYPDIGALFTAQGSSVTTSQFVAILTKARKHCENLHEQPINYAAISASPSTANRKRRSTDPNPGRKAKRSRKARATTSKLPRSQPAQSSVQVQVTPRKTVVGRFSDWEDSAGI